MHTPSGNVVKKNICVFCGSSPGADPAYLEAARRMGELIGTRGHALIYGGGATGLMGILARAALAAGAQVTGVRPAPLDHLEVPQAGIAMVRTEDLFERKREMIRRSDAFLILPGGLGTLDEFFEVITTAQLGMHRLPIVVVNTGGYFDPLLGLLQHTSTAGFIYGEMARLFHVVATPEKAMALL